MSSGALRGFCVEIFFCLLVLSRCFPSHPEDDKLNVYAHQALEMLSRLENHFRIELPDYEVQGISDFKTLAQRIQARL